LHKDRFGGIIMVRARLAARSVVKSERVIRVCAGVQVCGAEVSE